MQQEEAAALAMAMLRRAAQGAQDAQDDHAGPQVDAGPLVVADLGASQGRNSMHPIAAALDVLDAHDRPVIVVHTDLPDNDFSSLFETVASDPDSYRRPGVFTYAVGRSFYEQLFPASTVTLGWSATAAVWLSATPCPLPASLFSYTASGDERATWKQAALRDWTTFLRHRATELRDGGQLVVTLPVAGPGYLEWMHVVEAGARDAVETGVVTREELAAMVVPTYLSAVDDLRTTVTASDTLALEECELSRAPDPAYASYREHDDPARYAAEAVELFRACAEPSLVAGIDAARADPFFACVQARLAATPTECPWTIGTLRVRRRERRRRP